MRIEDTDRTRFSEGSLEEIMAALRWMGLDWDEGPEVGGDYGPYFQSQRLDIYRRCAEELIARKMAYRCYCTKERLEELRNMQEAAKLPVGYDRRCRDLTEEERAKLEADYPNPVIRFAMKTEGVTEFEDVVRGRLSFDNALQDDLVIIKADGFPTYNFANVVDDHLMQITHVIRGEEFLSSTPKHVQMYEAFGWKPPVWVHPSLILDEQRRKLSKRSDTQTRFTSYIEDGYLPEAMLNFLATMGWSSGEDKKLYSRAELIDKFDLGGIASHAAVFDLAKLNDLQGEYVRMKTLDELAELIMPYLQSAGFISQSPSEEERAYLVKVARLVQPRLVLLKDAPEMLSFFYRDDFDYDEKGAAKYLAKDTTPALLNAVIERISEVSDWNIENIESAVRQAGVSVGLEGGAVIHPIRMAVTGRTFGPGLFELMEVLGKDRCLARLRRAIQTHSSQQ